MLIGNNNYNNSDQKVLKGWWIFVINNKRVLLGIVGIIGIDLLIVFSIINFGDTTIGPAQAENSSLGFTSDSLEFEDIAIELLRTDHNDSENIMYEQLFF